MADSADVTRTRWGATVAVLAAGVVGGFQIGKLPASLHLLREDLGLGLIAAGWVISTISVVGVATGVASGWIGDRIGHRRTLLLGMAILALGSLAGSWAWDEVSILASRFIEGLGYIALITAAPTLLYTLSASRDRSMVMGVYSFYLPFGMAGMVVISPFVLAMVSWRGLWVLNAALAVLAMAAVALAIQPDRSPARTDRGGTGAPQGTGREPQSYRRGSTRPKPWPTPPGRRRCNHWPRTVPPDRCMGCLWPTRICSTGPDGKVPAAPKSVPVLCPITRQTVLTKLDGAGALDIARLNMVEFALGTTGHNSITGDVRIPWNRDHVTGGSSRAPVRRSPRARSLPRWARTPAVRCVYRQPVAASSG